MTVRNGYAEYGVPAGYYDRNGEPIELLHWADLTKNNAYRLVAYNDFRAAGFVSTVWRGVPMPTLMPPPGLIFETMVFMPDSVLNRRQWGHATLDQAIEVHDMVALSVWQEITHRD